MLLLYCVDFVTLFLCFFVFLFLLVESSGLVREVDVQSHRVAPVQVRHIEVPKSFSLVIQCSLSSVFFNTGLVTYFTSGKDGMLFSCQ